MKISYRKATKRDISFVQAMSHDLCQFEIENCDNIVSNPAWPQSESGKKYYETFKKKHFLYVAVCGNTPVAYCCGATYKKGWNRDIVGELTNLYVDPQYRHMGIGIELTNRFKKYCRKKKAVYLVVTFMYNNQNAESFYRKQDFFPYEKIYLSGPLNT